MNGYHRLASVIAAGKNELGIFRKFLAPNALNLLFMQAEIADLQDTSQVIIKADCSINNESEQSLLKASFTDLKKPGANEMHKHQLRAIYELRKLIKDYNEALLLFARVCKLRPADKKDLDVLKDWMNQPDGGNTFLNGLEAFIWDDIHQDDLTAPASTRHEQDFLTQFVETKVVHLYHELWGHRFRKRMQIVDPTGSDDKMVPTAVHMYPEGPIRVAVEVFSVAMSWFLPLASLCALYFVRETPGRMVAIVGFTILFSITLKLVTRARRVDYFIATAVFVAVQVIFVGIVNRTNTV